MKDGRTLLAHKAEYAVDLESGALAVQPSDRGDTTSIFETLDEAEVVGARADLPPIKGAVLDKGYHSTDVLVRLRERNVRGYASEPDRGRRRWRGKREDS